MFKRKILFVLFLAVFLISACGSDETSNSEDSTNGDDETFTFRVGNALPDTHFMTTDFFIPFMERITELTEGQVEFEHFPAEQLGKATDYIELTNDGIMDMGYYVPPYYPSKMPIGSTLFGMPGVYDSALDGIAFHEIAKQEPTLSTDYLNNGVRPVLSLLTPPYQIWTTDKQVKVPEDIKSEQLRSPGGVASNALNELGATPISLSAPEIYESLERGIVDGALWYAGGVNDFGLNELTNYGTRNLNFGGLVSGLFINEELFQELPQNVKDAIVQAGDEVTESFAELFQEDELNKMQEFEDSGSVEMHELTEEELSEWQEFYDEFNKSAREEIDVSEELSTALEQFNEEVEKNK